MISRREKKKDSFQNASTFLKTDPGFEGLASVQVSCETKRHLGPERAFCARESLVLHSPTTLEPTSGPTGVGRIDLGARESARKRLCDIDSGTQVLRERTDFWKSTMGAKTDHHSQIYLVNHEVN